MSCLLRPGPVAGTGSKLGELIGKLHEYLESATEDKNEPTLPGHWNGTTGNSSDSLRKPDRTFPTTFFVSLIGTVAKEYLEMKAKAHAAEEVEMILLHHIHLSF